jgi:DNA-binding response OmpR family regulator
MALSKVLIVEDDSDLAESLARPLREKGFDVAVASDAASSLALADREAPSLIVVDLAIRNGGAYKMMDRMRLFPHVADTPVVALTRFEGVKEKQKIDRAGVAYFLEKPVEGDELVSIATRMARRRLRTF